MKTNNLVLAAITLVAIADISNYIKLFYNQVRRHQYLGRVSSDEFKAAAQQA